MEAKAGRTSTVMASSQYTKYEDSRRDEESDDDLSSDDSTYYDASEGGDDLSEDGERSLDEDDDGRGMRLEVEGDATETSGDDGENGDPRDVGDTIEGGREKPPVDPDNKPNRR